MRQAPPPTDFSRLSLNQITTQRWSLREAIEGCARHGIPSIGIWRDKLQDAGLAQAVRWVRDAGLRVSTLCRGGWFLAPTEAERKARLDDNRRAIDEAAELNADALVLVCGPAFDKDLQKARAMIEEAIAAIAPYASERQVKLGIEPLHPMVAADRSAVVTLAQALSMAERYDARQVGVTVDTFNIWWDPELYPQITRAAGRIHSYQVSDWPVPLPDTFMGRAMMGDGVIELRRIRRAVTTASYTGFIEVEIMNHAIWDMPGDDVIRLMKERYLAHV